MKKIALIALLMCIAFVDYGQGYVSLTPYTAAFAKKTTPDTTVNTDTTYLVCATTSVQNYPIQVDITNTKVSGTVGGSVIMQGSNNLTTWWTLKNYSTDMYGTSDTTTLTNATLTMPYGLSVCRYKYLRWRFITSGTQSSVPTGTLYWCPTLIKNLN